MATIFTGRAYLRRRAYRVGSGPYFPLSSSLPSELLDRVRSADLRTKLVLSVICLLFLYWPLIDVRYYFLDDVGRSVEGYYKYTGSGRPLTDVLLHALSWGGYLTDISPAPQLLGVFCLALAAVLLAEAIYLAAGQLRFPVPAAIDADFGGPKAVGLLLFSRYLLPFEVTSILLLVAMVGAITLTLRKEKAR